ncbi:hypothetical protein CPT03_06110 [Pedobacter ginsengisoli]|uniref:Transposase n=2 Tax=Pedobacter ginsengisoli TaxID=363852 RepID=A0A2D1U362_9SPHI|nr:hypothetical protein CPT03_06110 [Pedobacter ginsengisoli]
MSNLNPDEMAAYEASLKIARDNYSHDETIRKEGELKGKLEGKLEEKRETPIKLISINIPIEKIDEITGLPIEEIEKL